MARSVVLCTGTLLRTSPIFFLDHCCDW